MMLEKFARPPVPVIAGVASLASCLLAALLIPPAWRETIRENAFDLVLAADDRIRPTSGNRVHPRVTVIDIDRRSIEALGEWPWPRETMARLIEAVAAAQPAAIAVDVLFAGIDSRSPAALARHLGALTGRADLVTLADELPDGDKRLADAVRRAPVVLGFVLDPDHATTVPAVPFVTRGRLPFEEMWRAAGAAGPVAELERAAQGIGALSLFSDADGLVRRVPLLVEANDSLLPGLALEAVRVEQHASAYRVEAEPPTLRIGELAVPLPRDALLRLVPVAEDRRTGRTVSAVDVVEGRADAGRIAGALALVGGSAPELGGGLDAAGWVGQPITGSL